MHREGRLEHPPGEKDYLENSEWSDYFLARQMTPREYLKSLYPSFRFDGMWVFKYFLVPVFVLHFSFL